MKSVFLAAFLLLSLSAHAQFGGGHPDGPGFGHPPGGGPGFGGPGFGHPGFGHPGGPGWGPHHPGPGPGWGFPPPPPPRPLPPPPPYYPPPYTPPMPPPPPPSYPPGGGYYGGQNVVCHADDAGWEEHFGGHPDCGSCLSQHGRCIETCAADSYTCVVQGQVFNPATNQYIAQNFLGHGNDRFAAENQAQQQCNWARGANCFTQSCQNQPQVVSTRSCN